MKKLHEIEYPSMRYVIADNVICGYCGLNGLVTKGREDCPHCRTYGMLIWANREKQEVEI